jgi:hypothetical protein
VSDLASTPSVPSLDLQFDHALAADGTPAASPAATGIPCAACGTAIGDQYFRVGRKQVCARCRSAIEAHETAARAELRKPMQTVRALLFGLGAAVLGAILYYAVIAITGFEVGYVALAIGYGVGYAIRKATRGRGARRFQVIAVVLTYFAVGLAYIPLAFGGSDKHTTTSAPTVAQDTARATTPAAAPSSSHAATSTHPRNDDSIALGVLVLLAAPFFLPVVAVVGSLPMGVLTAIIIAVGLRQAWRMTAPTDVAISGPFRVGSRAPEAA